MFGELALKLYDQGWRSLIPIKPGDKRPAISGWPEYGKRAPTRDAIAKLAERHPDAGIGLAYGPASPMIAMDIDILDAALAGEARAICEKALGVTPLVRQGRPPKLLMLYRKAEVFEIAGKFFGAFECFCGAGVQTVIFGRHPDTGLAYEWIAGASPIDTTPDQLPAVGPDQVYAAIDALGELISASGYQRPDGAPGASPERRAPSTPKTRQRPSPLQRGASDRTSGAMAAVLPKLRAADDPLAEAERLATTAGYGSRYGTAFGLIAALKAMGYGDDAIERAVIGPYLARFTGPEAKARANAIETAMAWARSTIGADDQFRDAGANIAASLAEGWR